MGITGLLPALRSIQEEKHLSQFAGKTIAVDAYVWLHKGVLGCATDLATGKPTHRYVDYAMRHVKLMRYHGVEPYIVFDGGPLPAKRGTEDERKKNRDASLAEGNLLAARGKKKEAEVLYLKSIDVTPQMAYQLIKALKAESVRYVVAPYEADAQMTYLEREGIVDGIMTEDSDLLVFGCRTMLSKFDPRKATVVTISRDHFGSCAVVPGDPKTISLAQWSDVQFRSMAILSGCDYLASIKGIGLKTAYTALRTSQTWEKAVRCLLADGKKTIPRDYVKNFALAEKCFLHQRVYDPRKERLVHLAQVDANEWDAEADEYVGPDIEPSLAKKIAEGDACPITLLPMHDICPSFKPELRVRALRDLPVASTQHNRKDKGKAKATNDDTRKTKTAEDGILSFFGPNPKIPPRTKSPLSRPLIVKSKMVVGKASGKRTLADVMDQDFAAKKNRRASAPSALLTQSKFFGTPTALKARAVSGSMKREDGAMPVAGPSRLAPPEKENIDLTKEDDDEEADADDLDSMIAQGRVDAEMEIDIEDPADAVEQEDRYLSPTPSCSKDMDDFSSPLKPGCRGEVLHEEIDFGEAISSPPTGSRNRTRRHESLPFTPTRGTIGTILVHASPTPGPPDARVPGFIEGPDLRDSFGDEQTSEIDCFDDEMVDTSPNSPSSPSPSPLTSEEARNSDLADPEELASIANVKRNQAVAAGWKEKWAFGKSRSGKDSERMPLKRRETNITPVGRHKLVSLGHSRSHPYLHASGSSAPNSASASSKSLQLKASVNGAKGRKSLAFLETSSASYRDKGADGDLSLQMGVKDRLLHAGDSTEDEAAVSRAQSRLARFRCG